MNSGAYVRLAVVLGTSRNTSEVEKLLEPQKRMLTTLIQESELSDNIESDGLDLIVVEIDDMGADESEIFTNLRARFAEMPILLVSNELPHGAVKNLLRFNVQDWLVRPLDQRSLIETIQNMAWSNRSGHNKVHAVISCVGGAGATTVAINMADIACRQLASKNHNIALVDLDYSTGDCGYVLNMISNVNLGDLSAAHRRVDAELISFIQQHHDAGFFLYSFKRPELNADTAGQELILRLLDTISTEHQLLFLDLPYYDTPWRNDVLAGVNSCTLVSEVNLPAIKHTLDLIRQIKALRSDDIKLHVLFNKHSRAIFGQRISKRKLQELLGDTPFSFLPIDKGVIGEAADRGILPSEVSPRSAFLRKLARYMKSLDMVKDTKP